MFTHQEIKESIDDWYQFIEQKEKMACENNDFDEAIAIAKIYQDQYRNQKRDAYSNKIIHWLIQAYQFKPDVNIDVDEFLASLEHISYQKIFKNPIPSLLMALCRNTTIKQFTFGLSCDPECITDNFFRYLSETHALKELNMSRMTNINDLFYSDQPGYKSRYPHLPYDKIQLLAKGLHVNDSIESLILTDQLLGNEGLIILLEALEKNPQTKLKELNIACTGITQEGQHALEKFLETNTTLESVNVYGNKIISKENIVFFVERNKKTNEQKHFDECFKTLEKNVANHMKIIMEAKNHLFLCWSKKNMRMIKQTLDKIKLNECCLHDEFEIIINAAKIVGDPSILQTAIECSKIANKIQPDSHKQSIKNRDFSYTYCHIL